MSEQSETSANIPAETTANAPVPVERATTNTGRAINSATIEIKTHFELDDAMIFNLNGDGIKITMVTEN
jgi:hypothetical protein